MIFYTARNDENRLQIVGTQADAKAINKAFEQIDIPTDKAALMAWAQEMFARLDEAEADAASARQELEELRNRAIDAPPLMAGDFAPAQPAGAAAEAPASGPGFGYEHVPTSPNPFTAAGYDAGYPAPAPALASTAAPAPVHSLARGPVPLAEEFEIAWEAFPLALKLHYAELAIHDARVRIRPGKAA